MLLAMLVLKRSVCYCTDPGLGLNRGPQAWHQQPSPASQRLTTEPRPGLGLNRGPQAWHQQPSPASQHSNQLSHEHIHINGWSQPRGYHTGLTGHLRVPSQFTTLPQPPLTVTKISSNERKCIYLCQPCVSSVKCINNLPCTCNYLHVPYRWGHYNHRVIYLTYLVKTLSLFSILLCRMHSRVKAEPISRVAPEMRCGAITNWIKTS